LLFGFKAKNKTHKCGLLFIGILEQKTVNSLRKLRIYLSYPQSGIHRTIGKEPFSANCLREIE